MDEKNKDKKYLVHLARLSLTGRRQDIELYIRRIARTYRTAYPELTEELSKILHELPTRNSPIRSDSFSSIPVDLDSRLQLLRYEDNNIEDFHAIWDEGVANLLEQIVSERQNQKMLMKAGLNPTKAVLFTGKPGVGKSLAAKWLSHRLKLPLLTLDLSAVMSSFLGRTGTNLRYVIDYAKSIPCILFLDELDSVAKRRDDAAEIGELKRLVTVILQEIDDWPSSNLLIAATNHPSLLDPAVWRRFDVHIDFPMPNNSQIKEAVKIYLGKNTEDQNLWEEILATIFIDKSYSDIERTVTNLKREALMKSEKITDVLYRHVSHHIKNLSRSERSQVALLLSKTGLSQRQVNEITGVSRDTIRRAITNVKDSKI